jgi:phage gp29-like protein
MPTKTSKPEVQILNDWRNQAVTGLPAIGGFQSRPSFGVPQPSVPSVNSGKLEVVKKDSSPGVSLSKIARLSGWGMPMNLSTTLDVSRIQAALRTAERGDCWMLFTIYRDMEMGFTHFQSEFAKRKLTVVGQPHTLLPKKKGKKDDEIACEVIDEMIDNCDNWNQAMGDMLDATLWPVSVGEKIFSPVEPEDKTKYTHPVNFRLRELSPVDPVLYCYKIPYLAAGFSGMTAPGFNAQPPNDSSINFNPDDWEAWLRFYTVNDNGYPNFSPTDTYKPDRRIHMVHRGTNLSKVVPDNYGGHMRAILFWWFLATQARDWWGRYMQKWGHPYVVAKVDTQQKDTVNFIVNALALSMEIGGLVIDKGAEAQLMQAASLNGSEGYKVFEDFCHDEVSKVVVGQTLSSSAKSTGLGSGVADLHGKVRDDYRQSDMRKLSDTLVKQLFNQYLEYNGYKGRVKGIIWGGKDEKQVFQIAQSVSNFKDAGLQPTDRGIETINERTGIEFERAPEPVEAAAPPSGGAKKPKTKPKKVKANSVDEAEEVGELVTN